MDRALAAMAAFVVFTASTVCATSPGSTSEETRSDFERLAAAMPYLDISSVLYDRRRHLFRAAESRVVEEHFRVLDAATGESHGKTSLIQLLGHHNPRVRTLAAVALFDREDPSVLPSLVRLCGDDSPTFCGHPPLSAAWLSRTGIGPPPRAQTVGGLARRMVAFYMEPAGYYDGVSHETEPRFAEYWELRKDRPHCASWFAVRLARASRSTSPTPTDCRDRIRRLREQIEELPPTERAWTLLWLNGDCGSGTLVAEEELIRACQTVGPEKLLLMLQRQIPSDDPDLRPRPHENRSYKRMQHFVLRHAERLLPGEQSDDLLACEHRERNDKEHGITDPTITPWWAIAAARLDQGNSLPILHAAFERFQGRFESDERAAICAELWHLGGKSEVEFLADWFYGESPERGSSPNCRGGFIELVKARPNGRLVLAELVRDPRMSNLDWGSLERLLRAANTCASEPVVSKTEIDKVWHPLGMAHYHWEKEQARESYPKETEELEATLNDWRERLRKSLPEWGRLE